MLKCFSFFFFFRIVPHDAQHHFEQTCEEYNCEVKYVHTYSCMTYLHLPEDLDCAIPCHLKNCTKQILHKWTMCPVWKCYTHDDPLTPAVPLHHPLSVATIVLSLLGTVMLTLLVTLVAIKIKRWFDRRNHQQMYSPEESESHNPIYSKKKKFYFKQKFG